MTISLLAMLLAIDPCAPVESIAPDPALAGVYAKVAREEERRGAREASTAAWRMAAALEGAGGPAAQALRQLCEQATRATSFQRGQALFDGHDCAGALPHLRQARGGPDDAPAALLEGICAWELGDDAAASSALGVARADPQLAPTAELYLGLLALRQGDSRSALSRMRTAGQLLRLAESKDRLVLEATVEGGYDSNATASAFSTVLPGGADDGFVSATASILLRPWADHGPFLLVGGGYRKQVLFAASDVGLATGTLGWDFSLGRLRGSVDYGLDFVSLGAVPWMLRQRGTVRALAPIGPLILSAEYGLRHETLWAESVRADSGLRHAGRLAASVFTASSQVELAAVVTRATAATADRSSFEAGGELRGLLQLTPRLALEATLGARWRSFDAVDPDLQVQRRELQLDGQAGADWALNRNVAIFALVEGRSVASSVAALTYARVGASAGLRFSLGVW